MTRTVPMGYLKKTQKSESVEKPEMEMIARKWKKWKRKVTQKDSLDYLSNSMSHLFENVPTTKECFQTNTHIHIRTHKNRQILKGKRIILQTVL